MKKTLLLLSFLLINISVYSQRNADLFETEQGHVFEGKSLKIKGGGEIKIGEEIRLGRGSDDNGTFRYIQVNEASMMRAYNTNGTQRGVQEANALPNKFNGLKGKIIDIVDRGNKRTGYKVFVIIGVGEMRRYQIDLDSALEYGEVIVDGYVNPNKKEEIKAVASSSSSIADEIKKLKELKESGIITEEEYEKAKSKLIN